jgi:hypothetical protein
LTDRHGEPIQGTHSLTFKVYTADGSGATLLWTEVHTGVSITEGIFHIILGSLNPIGDDLFAESPRWMGITVDSDPEIAPRMELTSVPWALNAAVADSARHVAGGVADGHSLDAADGDPSDVVHVEENGFITLRNRLECLPAPGDPVLMTTGVFSMSYEVTPGDRTLRFNNSSDYGTGGFDFHASAPAFNRSLFRIQNNGEVGVAGRLSVSESLSLNAGSGYGELTIRPYSPGMTEPVHQIKAAGFREIIRFAENNDGSPANVEIAGRLSVRDWVSLSGGYGYGDLTISPYSPGMSEPVHQIKATGFREIIRFAENNDGSPTHVEVDGQLSVRDVMRLEPRVTFPDNPQDGDLCVRRYEVPVPPDPWPQTVCHVYCYLLGQWKQLDD